MPCHYSKGGEVSHISCPSCGHEFPHEALEDSEPRDEKTPGDHEAHEAMEEEDRPDFIVALRRRRMHE